MKNDVILSKIEIIERCIIRVQEVYENNPENLLDYTKQDSIILNLQRACEASIDLAMHIVSEQKLGIPKTSRGAFSLLENNGYIDSKVAKNMIAMIGFLKFAVHDYQSINLNILQSIIEKHLQDFKLYTKQIIISN